MEKEKFDLGKPRKVIVIPQTDQDDKHVGFVRIGAYHAKYRFNEPVTLRNGVIEFLKNTIVEKSEIQTSYNETTKKTSNKHVVKEIDRYKIIELSKEFMDKEESAENLIEEAGSKD